jgi:hypothetical protein
MATDCGFRSSRPWPRRFRPSRPKSNSTRSE